MGYIYIIGIAMVYQANAYRFWSAENGENCDQLLDFGSILGYFLKKNITINTK
jgi:hypothetical protein